MGLNSIETRQRRIGIGYRVPTIKSRMLIMNPSDLTGSLDEITTQGIKVDYFNGPWRKGVNRPL